MYYQRRWPIIVCINHDLGLTLAYFTATSNSGTQVIIMEKSENAVVCSGSFVTCEMKYGRYRQRIEFIKLCENSR